MKAENKCIRCFRMKPRVVEHIMADLPKKRLNGSHASKVTGIDFCGPFFYKSEARNKPPVKCYVCYSFVVNQGSLYGIVFTWPQTIYMH